MKTKSLESRTLNLLEVSKLLWAFSIDILPISGKMIEIKESL